MFYFMTEKTAVPSRGELDGQVMPPGTGRAVLVGTLIGFVLVGGFFGGVAYLLGASTAAALTLALFTGAIGGPGFGGMMGFVLNQSRVDEHKG